ncbi:class I SAM-dependent methyltransferase [Candidatus Fermentibacteria bacterium]|nr:class I SAM-dependent methyltransferase [Candidatus Fermentibacteria bacterium]
MSPDTARRLLEINRAFYEDHAREFSDTRSPSGSELEWIIPWVPARARVLDLGCGNGRVARLLAARGWGGSYVGVDASATLLDEAREGMTTPGAGSVSFLQCDVVNADPSAVLRQAGIAPLFDTVLLLALLHHIPTAQARQAMLGRAEGLMAPAGRILVSTWQFLDNERMRRKLVSWSVAGIDEGDVDPNDALLGWRGSGAYRYCHWIDTTELADLAGGAALKVAFATRAGGREGTLSLCAVLARGGSSRAAEV